MTHLDSLAAATAADVTDADALRGAVQVLVDQQAIRDMAALYAMAVDDHDIEAVLDSFSQDGVFVIDGAPVTGLAELRPFYVGMMDRYTTTLHVPHTHVVQVTGDAAVGVMTGHAELAWDGTLVMAAYRYDDRYGKRDGRWVFVERVLRFMYAVPFDDMGASFADDKRMRWPGTPPAPAELPEQLPTWSTYPG